MKPKMIFSVLDLPRELQLEIVAWLDVHELKQFSTCSKACRGVSQPFLFRSIQVTPQTIGSGIEFLDEIAKYARRILLTDSNKHGCGDFSGCCLAAIPLCQAFESRLHLFTNVINLEVHYITAVVLEKNLYAAFFQKLELSPIWKTLRRIALIFEGDKAVQLAGRDDHVIDVYPHLSDTQKDYLGDRNIPGDQSRGIELKFPPNTEEAVIKVRSFALQMPWAGSDNNAFWALYYINPENLGGSLRRLDISGQEFCRWSEKSQIKAYPRITHLKYRTKTFFPLDLTSLINRFPSLEQLDILDVHQFEMSQCWPLDRVDYPQIQELKQLRRVALPWPLYEIRSPNIHANGEVRSSFALIERLKSSVEKWENGGMENLEFVTFGAFNAHAETGFDIERQLTVFQRPTTISHLVVKVVKGKDGWTAFDGATIKL